jgi:hypothetical protein
MRRDRRRLVSRLDRLEGDAARRVSGRRGSTLVDPLAGFTDVERATHLAAVLDTLHGSLGHEGLADWMRERHLGESALALL